MNLFLSGVKSDQSVNVVYLCFVTVSPWAFMVLKVYVFTALVLNYFPLATIDSASAVVYELNCDYNTVITHPNADFRFAIVTCNFVPMRLVSKCS